MLSSLPPFYLMIKQVDYLIANTFLGQHFCPLPIFDGCEPSLLYHSKYCPQLNAPHEVVIRNFVPPKFRNLKPPEIGKVK